jgi:hypothetical protein
MKLPVTWSVTKVLVLPQVDKFENFVVRVFYSVEASEKYMGHFCDDPAEAPDRELTAVAEDFGMARFELDPSAEFTPASELTKATVLSWVKAQLGEEAVNNIEESLRTRIVNTKNPPAPVFQVLNLN